MKKFLFLMVAVAVFKIGAVPNPQKYLRIMTVRQNHSKNASKNVMVPAVPITPEQQEKIVKGIAQARSSEMEQQLAQYKALKHLEERYDAYRVRLSLHCYDRYIDSSELIKGEKAGEAINGTIACCKNLVLNPDGSCKSGYFKEHSGPIGYNYMDLKTNSHCLCYQDSNHDRIIGKHFASFLKDVVRKCPECMSNAIALSKK